MLASTHSKRSKRDRKAKKTPASNGAMPTLTEKYNSADETVTAVYVDIANGMSRSDCLEKIQQGLYGNKPVKARQSAYIYNAALDRFAVDTDIEADRLRNLFWGRYETIYADCVNNNDRYNARCTLDSMVKIFLGDLNKTQNNIQINSMGDGKVVVTFGFGEENKEDDIEDQDAKIVDENLGN